MVSEKLLNYRAGIVLLLLNIISFTGAGIMIAIADTIFLPHCL
jgi:hypothetical protein